MQTVILIGAARSGTKFLRDTLGASPEVGTVPYDVNYVWRYRNESFPDDALPVTRADNRVKNYVITTLSKQGRIGRQKHILLEKTVSNTLRIPFVNQIFPDAKFIHLVRDGKDVVESAYRMWQQRPDWRYLVQKARAFPLSNYKYAAWYLSNLLSGIVSGQRGVRVWGPRYPDMERDAASKTLIEVCAWQWAKSVEYAMRDLGTLAPERVLTVRYETLLADENKVGDIARFAGIDDTDLILSAYRKNVRRDTGGGWSRLSVRDRELAMRIMGLQLAALGYLNIADANHDAAVAQ
jgi:hypothetical protein